MQTTNDVKLARALLVGLPSDLYTLFNRPFVGLGMPHATIEPAESAIGDANVRVVHVAIHIVIGEIAVDPFTYLIRKSSNRKQVVALKQSHPVFEGQALPAVNFVGDLGQLFR